MHAGTSQVLLPFKKGASRAIQSAHDGNGELRVAFAIASAELAKRIMTFSIELLYAVPKTLG
jgi:hypothetical protein